MSASGNVGFAVRARVEHLHDLGPALPEVVGRLHRRFVPAAAGSAPARTATSMQVESARSAGA